jgi:hypothetical protein
METKYFLKNESKKMIKYWEENAVYSYTIESDDGVVSFIYHLFKEKSWDFVIHIVDKNIKLRKTKLYYEMDEKNIDNKKITDSIRANWIHYIDALLIRDLNKKNKFIYISIHDCVLVKMTKVSEFLVNVNDVNNIKIFENLKWNKNNSIKFRSIFSFI